MNLRLRTLGFMTKDEARTWARANGCSWMGFQGNFVPEYTLWQRLRLALLLLWGRDMSDLAPQFKRGRGPTIEKVMKRVEKWRGNPEIVKALHAAAEALGDEEEEPPKETPHDE